jgi:DNA replication protein DnaC
MFDEPVDKDDGIYTLEKLRMQLKEEEVVRPSQWGAIGARIFKSFSVTHTEMPAGCYSVTLDKNDDRSIFIGKYLKNDDIIDFKDGLAVKLLEEIDNFWSKGNEFKKHGFLHRRGYMLYGSQGVGKSSIVSLITKDIIKRGGVVLICDNPRFFIEGLKTFRQVEANRPLVCVFEDIDAIIKKYGDKEILSILDGDSQVDKVINIATTNYPELLNRRIVNRPRRFDRIYKIEVPSDSIREQFLKTKLPKDQNLKRWMKLTKGLSFAALTETLISVICLDNKLEDVTKILEELENGHIKSSDFSSTNLGFSVEEAEE